MFYVLDERHVWHEAIINAANDAGFIGKRVFRGTECDSDGFGFIRCHAEPKALKLNQFDYDQMSARLTMIQDADQVRLYEDKTGQWRKWVEWMPETWRIESLNEAVEFLKTADYPIVSKADIGASSVNVRILRSARQAIDHAVEVFNKGIIIHHCADGAKSIQNDYLLLQRFIQHTTTFRVNAIGSGRAIFQRYNYPDRPVAQTGNVEPVLKLNEKMESLLDFSNRFFDAAKTKWCAIDVLSDGDGWKLIETSLAWPWPSPGQCNKAPIFNTDYKWLDMFDALMSEVRGGEFGGEHLL